MGPLKLRKCTPAYDTHRHRDWFSSRLTVLPRADSEMPSSIVNVLFIVGNPLNLVRPVRHGDLSGWLLAPVSRSAGVAERCGGG